MCYNCVSVRWHCRKVWKKASLDKWSPSCSNECSSSPEELRHSLARLSEWYWSGQSANVKITVSSIANVALIMREPLCGRKVHRHLALAPAIYSKLCKNHLLHLSKAIFLCSLAQSMYNIDAHSRRQCVATVDRPQSTRARQQCPSVLHVRDVQVSILTSVYSAPLFTEKLEEILTTIHPQLSWPQSLSHNGNG